jgi:NDP-sugar pyrophosphorylase family protein
MKFALIAAGQGSRLVSEGVSSPKPLVEIAGEPLLARLFRLFIDNGATGICIIINEEMTEVHRYLQMCRLPVPLEIAVHSTPDSLHSFHTLMPLLANEDKFCLTTVDPVFRPAEFKAYIKSFQADTENDALMAVTDYVDDERPLYVRTDADNNIVGYSNIAAADARFVSGGIYCLTHHALELLPKAMKNEVSRMRGYQQFLVDEGLKMKAWQFSTIIDIDHAEDIRKAEQFLSQE